MSAPVDINFLRSEALAFSVTDAGRVVGLSRTSMWRLIASGELKTFKIGGRTLVAREDLQALVSRHRSAA